MTAPEGFVAGGVYAGIRRRQTADLAIVHSTRRATGAGMFTTNRVKAAPVLVSEMHLASAEPQAVVINSGVANAATGDRGELDAINTAAETSRLLGLTVEEIVVLSTGLIGANLPLGKVRSGLRQLVPNLSEDGGDDAAEAILTTDTRKKTAVASGPSFTIGGMAKGSGMIHPSLATMLAVVTTDYPLKPGETIDFLRPAVDASFNRISVDGDCSTNDAVILLANGASGAPRDDEAFRENLELVCADLSRQIVEDGEGVSVVIEVSVTGAADSADAEAVASRVAGSSLVKTAAFGKDPNWGRVVAAAGSAPTRDGFARVEIGSMSVAFNGTKVLSGGAPTGATPDVDSDSLSIEVDLGLGGGSCRFLTSDLTHEYVRINSEYTT